MHRKTAKGACQHTYKITADGGVLFYRTIDRLVCYTLQSVICRRYRLRMLVSSLMFTHIHELSEPLDIVQLSAYQRDQISLFAKAFNRETGRTGPLFDYHFGSAVKRSDKDKRSCAIYVLNNPVEKRLVRRAIEDRWNFLAYYEQDYPFSSKPTLRRSRKALVDAVHLVEHEYHTGRPLGFPLLNHLFASLNEREREQLTDFIIQIYFFFDRQACYALFGDFDRMVSATDLTTGSEYDLAEPFDPHSDRAYQEMCAIAGQYGLTGPGIPLFKLPDVRLDRLGQLLRNQTSATDKQISRFIHRPFGRQ